MASLKEGRSTRRERRGFIGGSDARIIMSGDEAALIRLWREKRGEAEPEDFRDNLVVQLGVATEALNRTWYERNTGRARHRRPTLGSASGPSIPGRHPRRIRQRPRRRVRGQIHAALVVLGGGGHRKAHGPAAAQHVGDQRKVGGAVDHHRRGQVGRTDGPGRFPLPALSSSPPSAGSGAASRPARRRGLMGSSRRGRGSRRFGSST